MNDRVTVNCGIRIQLNGKPAEPRKQETPGLRRLKELARTLERRSKGAGTPSEQE